jgi:hypothetical protein
VIDDVWCIVDRISEFDSGVINYLVLYSVLDTHFIAYTLSLPLRPQHTAKMHLLGHNLPDHKLLKVGSVSVIISCLSCLSSRHLDREQSILYPFSPVLLYMVADVAGSPNIILRSIPLNNPPPPSPTSDPGRPKSTRLNRISNHFPISIPK